MLSYKESSKPSVVTHCAVIPGCIRLENKEGVAEDHDSLVVVRGDSLSQCFRGSSQASDFTELIWVSEVALQGTVQQLIWTGEKRLAISFSSAKLVELAWDNDSLTFVPESSHSYEQHSSGQETEHKLMLDARHKLSASWVEPDSSSVSQFSEESADSRAIVDNSARTESENPARSNVSLLDELCSEVNVAGIADMAFMPFLIEPTLAVLAWSRPSWAGFVSAHGPETKVLMSSPVRRSSSVRDSDSLEPPSLKIAELPYDISRIMPISGVDNRSMLLIGSRSLHILNEANEVCPVTEVAAASSEYGHDYSNCVFAQLDSTPYIFIVSQSGDALIVNTQKLQTVEHIPKWLEGGAPTTSETTDKYIVVGSRDSNAEVFAWSTESDASGPTSTNVSAKDIELSDLRELYSETAEIAAPEADTDVVRVRTIKIHELLNYGSFTGVATITDGLACATNRGVCIVERELALAEHDSVILDRDVEPGSFWLPSSSIPSRPLLVSSFVEIETPEHDAAREQEAEASSPTQENVDTTATSQPKRRRTEEPAAAAEKERAVTEFVESFHSSKKKSSRPADASVSIPRGISPDQITSAVYENAATVWVVQSTSIIVFEARSWKPVRSSSIEPCDFADVSSTRIMTYTKASGRCNIYDMNSLKHVFHVDQQDTATISSTLLVASQGTLLRVQDLHNTKKWKVYDASNLAKTLEQETGAQNSRDKTQKDPAYLSSYALRFHKTDYIGIHIDRVFAIYELINSRLVKRFTMPFAVNQSPIFLPTIETLLFPGKKTHMLVKGSQSAFQYHRSALYGDRLIDAIALPNKEFAWLDDKETSHFSRVDTTLEFRSFALPIRYVPLEVDGASIKTIEYHEDSASVVVGVNVETNFVPSAKNLEGEEAADHEYVAGQEVEIGDADANEDVPFVEEAEDATGESNQEVIVEIDAARMVQKEPSALTYHGQVYILNLEMYKFQPEPLATFEEALLSMCIIEFDEPKSNEILAVGTAGSTVESGETNGHSYLYKFAEINPSDEFSNETNTTDDTKLGDKHIAVNEENVRAVEPIMSLKLYVEEHLRGAVSSIVTTMRYLAVAHGNQIHIYNIHGHKKIDPIAFLNTDVYVQDLKVARNILGLGEKLRAPRLVNFSTTPHRTDLLASADPELNQETLSIEFVSSAARGDLSLVCASADRRIQVFQYDPENLDSNGGSRLVPISDFYSGRHCTAMCAAQIYNNNDLISYGVTSDGTLFAISPLNEEMYRTFYILVHQSMERESGEAGLNPKMYRSSLIWGPNHRNKMLDLDFAQRFWDLNLEQQIAYGRILGFQGLNRAQRASSVEGRDLLKL